MRNLITISGFLLLHAAWAQGQVFRTEADYPGAGLVVDGEIGLEPRMGRFVLTYAVGGHPKVTPCRQLWGFQYGNILYRIAPEGHVPVRLMAQGAVYYWENGFAHLRMQSDSMEAARFEFGRASYLSRDVKGEIVPACFKGKGMSKGSERFKEAWPAYAGMLECIGSGEQMDSTRQCVVEYEVAVEEGRASAPPASTGNRPPAEF
jgi:hypothetical protein